MRCLVACYLSLSLMIAAVGCRSCDRVESELRARENDVLQLREELDRCGVYNQTLQHEVHALRGQLGMPLNGPPPAAYPVQRLTLGSQTGGRSNDICPGDDALQVQVEPRDPDGHVIKAPGQLVIHTQEITAEGIKRPLSSWEIPPDEVRRTWLNGLLTTGYLLNLPWKAWPSTEKLRVTVLFQLADGRVFEADRDVTVRLTPNNQRPSLVPNTTPKTTPAPAFPPSPRPAGDGGPPLLPIPRLSDPAKPATPEPSSPVLDSFSGASNAMREMPAANILHPVPLRPNSGK
ncbi:MAG: hypothetical protein ACYC3I_19215 [Gemmataceae bacterium]